MFTTSLPGLLWNTIPSTTLSKYPKEADSRAAPRTQEHPTSVNENLQFSMEGGEGGWAVAGLMEGVSLVYQ